MVLLVILAVSSLMVIESANAQSTSKPSVPEFNAKYVDRSYDTQPTYGYDQYTGKTVITKPSEHVDNRTLEIKIKNQPFTQFTDQNGNNINLLYNVQYKGSFGQEWVSMFGERALWANGGYDPYWEYGFPTQDSSSQYTTISYSLPWNMVEGQIDIQVEALEGYTNRTVDPARAHILWTVYIYTFYGEESGWSNIQTVTIGEASTSTPNPTSPTISTPTSKPNNSTSIPSTNGNQTKVNDIVPLTTSLTTFLLVTIALVVIIAILLLLLYGRYRKSASLSK